MKAVEVRNYLTDLFSRNGFHPIKTARKPFCSEISDFLSSLKLSSCPVFQFLEISKKTKDSTLKWSWNSLLFMIASRIPTNGLVVEFCYW